MSNINKGYGLVMEVNGLYILGKAYSGIICFSSS